MAGIISGSKEGKPLDVVPMKMSERDDDLILLVTDSPEVFTEISDSSTGVKDGNAVRIRERDLQAGSIAAELLETRIANRNRSPSTVELELHAIILVMAPCSTKLAIVLNPSARGT